MEGVSGFPRLSEAPAPGALPAPAPALPRIAPQAPKPEVPPQALATPEPNLQPLQEPLTTPEGARAWASSLGPSTVSAGPQSGVRSRLQAEKDLGQDDSVLFHRRNARPQEPPAQVLFERSPQRSEAPPTFGATPGPLPQPTVDERIQWRGQRNKTVHKVLVAVVPKTVALRDVQILQRSQKVHAQIETARGETLEEGDLFRIRREFERRTGRELVLETASPAPPSNTSVAPLPPRTPSRVTVSSRAKDADPTPVETKLPSPSTDKDEPLRESASTQPPPRAKKLTTSYAVAGAEMAGGAATAAAHAAALVAYNPQVVYEPKIGIGTPAGALESRLQVSSTPGGGRTPSTPYDPRTRQEDEGEQQAQQQAEEQQKAAGGQEAPLKRTARTGSDPLERLTHAERLGLEERSEQSENSEGNGSGRSQCRTCGTELPAAQQHACPVCAQSGPDVIATVSVHYRFAGSKFLAAADSVAASTAAREVLELGQNPAVASLRYKPRIPGHKDLLKFRTGA